MTLETKVAWENVTGVPSPGPAGRPRKAWPELQLGQTVRTRLDGPKPKRRSLPTGYQCAVRTEGGVRWLYLWRDE